MRNGILIGAIIAMGALTGGFPALAADKPGVTVELTAHKVVRDAGGKEKLESAEKAKPGDVIEYKAVYRNTGKTTATNVAAVVPVPPGTEYLPGTAKPATVAASLDGKTYAAPPLKRQVKLPAGGEKTEEVPVAQYRYIRWDLKSLAPGKSSTVIVRVKISTT